MDWIRARYVAQQRGHRLLAGRLVNGNWVRTCSTCGAEAIGRRSGSWYGTATTQDCRSPADAVK